MWTSNVLWLIGKLSDEEKTSLWRIWLKQYWSDRIVGVPIALNVEESIHMLEWAVALDCVFTEVVVLISQSKAPEISQSTLVFYNLLQSSICKKYPESAADLLLYILPAASYPFLHGHYVRQILDIFKEQGVNEAKIEQIVEELERLGA